ncbi:MAG: OmpA family protein, partial [Mediterranea sp.]|jgi:outer membrane protein OmpA-like peptidoglycan-associated protein|nr:OmpA family protein [Mediterranea sp.]
MKRLFASVLFAALAATAANAQDSPPSTTLKYGGWRDNWSLGVYGGFGTPLQQRYNYPQTNGNAALELTRQLTPGIGLSLQDAVYFNATDSRTFVDMNNVSLQIKFNLINLIAGYQNSPRAYEIEMYAGMGLLHYYRDGMSDVNTWSTRYGVSLNLFVDRARAWMLTLKPSFLFDMEGMLKMHRARLLRRDAMFEFRAGVVYFLPGANGKRHFMRVRLYDQAEANRLNANINDLRGKLATSQQDLQAGKDDNARLQAELEKCMSNPVTVVSHDTVQVSTVQTITSKINIPETTITFRQGATTVDGSQLPNVERVATYMRRHPNTNVVIRGYASPEGNADINERIARQRAQAVHDILVRKYRIAPERIKAEGQGVGDMFSEPDWNRVSICTLVEREE